jgi:hydrogenase expression/formation protein HypD
MMNSRIQDLNNTISALAGKINRPLRLMEVCGTHTVAVFRHGIRPLLPEGISLLSGPGCPVCVTSARDVDSAIALSKEPDVVLCTFGDMMRVPGGSKGSLYHARAEGADVRVVCSPADALNEAVNAPDKKVVFFATGFETTAPLVSATVLDEAKKGVDNFFIYSVHKLVPPALEALVTSGEVRVDGLMLPGHVSTVIGSRAYNSLSERHKVPSVVTGFGAEDILEGILMLMGQIHKGKPRVEVQYSSVVKEEGNPRAVEVMMECFEPCDSHWRGIGTIEQSGLRLRERFKHRDASALLDTIPEQQSPDTDVPKWCSCGEVLRGIKVPTDCPLFGKGCTPDNPVGACMVSTEGSCAAYYRYR